MACLNVTFLQLICMFFLDETKLDVLINNAGMITEKSKTVDGFETQFGVNVLGKKHSKQTQVARSLHV